MFLDEYLQNALAQGHADAEMVSVIKGLANAAKAIESLIKRNGIDVDLGDEVGGLNADGDSQKTLDMTSEELIIKHLKGTGAELLLSEEQDDPVPLNSDGSLIVAVDPLDGSSNISVNMTIGTIFSILPSHGDGAGHALQKGRAQLGAGFFTYGPQTTLILGFAENEATDGGPVACFAMSPEKGDFIRIGGDVAIPEDTKEFAINSAYTKHWFAPMSAWMDETLDGKSGPCGKDYRMRWVGSLVADAWRIFQRGGIFLYPADQRKGNETGRLRLVYEANPMALLAEKAGGMATDGQANILDLDVTSLHQRVPLFFGAKSEVARLVAHHVAAGAEKE